MALVGVIDKEFFHLSYVGRGSLASANIFKFQISLSLTREKIEFFHLKKKLSTFWILRKLIDLSIEIARIELLELEISYLERSC